MPWSFCVTAFHVAFSLSWTQPDLLNFKKGWMTKLYEDGMVLLFIFSLLSQMKESSVLILRKNCSSFSSVEETLVCPDRSEFKVLQGLDCWGGKFFHTEANNYRLLQLLLLLFSWTALFSNWLCFLPQASELDGEIDLSTCYDVKEFPVQRNYGFQILVSVDCCCQRLSAAVNHLLENETYCLDWSPGL